VITRDEISCLGGGVVLGTGRAGILVCECVCVSVLVFGWNWISGTLETGERLENGDRNWRNWRERERERERCFPVMLGFIILSRRRRRRLGAFYSDNGTVSERDTEIQARTLNLSLVRYLPRPTGSRSAWRFYRFILCFLLLFSLDCIISSLSSLPDCLFPAVRRLLCAHWLSFLLRVSSLSLTRLCCLSPASLLARSLTRPPVCGSRTWRMW
jgi:hypothetical protein